MRNRWLLNLGLVVLVGVLVVLAVSKRRVDKEPPAPPLTMLVPEKIERIQIERPDNERLVLQRQGENWLLIAPLQARANPFRVESLLRLATAPSELRLRADPDALSKYGLDQPKASVWFGQAEIQAGRQHPFKNARYVRYGETIHLIPIQYFTPGTYSYVNFINPRLFARDRAAVAFELPQLSLRRIDGTWVAQPERENLTTERINEFVDRWRQAQALYVERYTGKPVQARIRITFQADSGNAKAGENVLELGILSYKPELVLYRQDEGLDYHFTEDTGKKLLRITADAEEAAGKSGGK